MAHMYVGYMHVYTYVFDMSVYGLYVMYIMYVRM